MKKNTIKLIFVLVFFITGQCFSQSASTFASTLGHSSAQLPDTAHRVTVTSAVKQAQPAVVTNTMGTANNNNTMKTVHVTLQRSATLDPNRPPMMAIPATPNAQAEDKNNQTSPKTGEPK